MRTGRRVPQIALIVQSLFMAQMLLPAGCAPPEPEGDMSARIQGCYEQPVTLGAILGNTDALKVSNLSEFREALDSTGHEYSLGSPDRALSLPTPRCLECQGRRYDRVMYLIFERSRQTRTLQRFILYLDGDRPVCIEDDFAYKNPYER
jgi:hypothetical protein